ncbi:hypothetical protein K7472_04245 [Streptomyces sp. PTM05]|uniref:Putative Flp pilus-assembly TadG-like N-terminal domain-containing protein n=2 Tax=Streptantibioticus parmotrematis TaxID=2873249 RepID=A0ABS7QQI2_9ACTN|nr:hypothetical protein [Streptantibioticus parmotrematis]
MMPVYVVVIGALLFLAFAYFAVGQAAATRNGAQTAADSAALAAAQDSGDQVRDALLDAFRTGRLDDIGTLLDGDLPGLRDSCDKAGEFAALNKAHTTDCRPQGLDGYAVTVETDYTVGRSVLAGTENRRAHADASAAIGPRCAWQPVQPAPSSTSSPTPSPGAPVGGPSPSPSPSPSATGPVGTLTCDGHGWPVDPSDLTVFPSVADLFDVHLTS